MFELLTPDDLTLAALAALCAGAVWFDVRESRIPNSLTVGGIALALALRAAGGWPEVGAGLAGAGIAFGLALPFFLAGGLGGGDAKLLAAVGAFLGSERILFALFLTALAGGVMAIVAMLRHRAVRQTMANLHSIFLSFGRRTFTGWKSGEESRAAVTLDTPGVITVPYGVAIAAGALGGYLL